MTKPYELDVTWTGPSGTEYEIPVLAFISTDPNYGADADGRRGKRLDNLDDIQLAYPDDHIFDSELDREEFSVDLLEPAIWEKLSNDL